MNQEDRDPILDAFLEEVFDQAAPPDLSQRIVDAWRERELASANGHEQSAAAQDSGAQANPQLANPQPVNSQPADSQPTNGNGRYATVASRSAAPPPPPVAPPSPPSVSPPSVAAANQVGRSPKPQRNDTPLWSKVVLGLALGVALLTALIAFTRQGDQVAKEPAPGESTDPVGQPSGPSNLAEKDQGAQPDENTPPRTLVADGPKAPSPDPEKKKGASAFEEPAPFERRVADKTNATQAQPMVATADPLSDQQIVEQLNAQLIDVWQVNSVEPAQLATDSEFCRRVFIALIGRIPTVHELDAFLKREESDKRAWLVNRLQTHSAYRPLYVANWTNFWTNVLIGRTGGQKVGSLSNRAGLMSYLKDSLENEKPYNQMVSELITAEGVNRPGEEGFNGAVNFMLAGYSQDSALAAARTARVFHGKQIQCVQCHNHPINETWTQNNFWEFNAFFRQMKAKRLNKEEGGKNGPVQLVDVDFSGESRSSLDEAEIYYERLDGVKRVAYPVFFDGTAISKRGDIASVNRRQELARLMVNSPALSRAVVNRLWARVFRFGLTNPIDDMGAHNPPDHPQMLELLAEQFEANQYSLDRLIRWMVVSQAFQLSSKGSDNLADRPDAGATPLFSRYYTRQLSPEAVYDSLLLAANQHKPSETVGGDYIKAQRAWLSQFSSDMGTDEGQETNTFSGDIRQSVVVMTSPVMERAVSNELGGVLHQVTNSSMTVPEKIEHLFLAALSRKPTPKELKAVRTLVETRRNDPASGLQDIWWALLNSNEFILDH